MKVQDSSRESNQSFQTQPLKKSIKSELDTHGQAPSVDESGNVFCNETFNEQPQLLMVDPATQANYNTEISQFNNEDEDKDRGVSFGIANPMAASQTSFAAADKFDDSRAGPGGSVISIKDIKEVQKDKVPASPSSQLVPEPRNDHWSGM